MDFSSLFVKVNDSQLDALFSQEHGADELPDLGSLFSIPMLPEKPQDPILDSLKANRDDLQTFLLPRIRTEVLPPELAVLSAMHADPLLERPLDASGLWLNTLSYPQSLNLALFWDRMRPGVPLDKPSPTPFISEQDDIVYSLAKHQSQQSPKKSNLDKIYLSQSEFLYAFENIVLGTSSAFHVWDTERELFVYFKALEGRQGLLMVEGMDEMICEGVSKRFLTIGTLLRRLETLLITIRTRSAREGPTIHAFAHSVSTILAYLRDEISRCPIAIDTTCRDQCLSNVLKQYAPYEDILVALSVFCGRSEDIIPADYPVIESAPIPLLDSIYEELRVHIERHSPRVITSIFAFILTNTSHDYLGEISQTVGYGLTYIQKSSHVVGERPDQYAINEVEEEEQTNDIFEAMDKLSVQFPSFFPQELLAVLPAAQKSLILLQESQPDHPSLLTPEGQEPIRWFWTEDEVRMAWNKTVGQPERQELDVTPVGLEDATSPISYKPELAQFTIFDQEPGFWNGSSALKSEYRAIAEFRVFVGGFPEELPSIAPTLPLLSSLVFSQLVEHASRLSDTLLTVFLASGSNLNLRAHLELLRSFLLVTSPAFESRLSAALFSDTEEYELDVKPNGLSLHALRRRPGRVVGIQPWAVGLAPTLLDREVWPPVGADLGFFLRTVIVDSIGRDETASDRDQISQEAEYRLGFAIRDLPAGSGKEKWLSPLSIEALDFLYMDYKPPGALEVLITPDILSKYQRMFAFILRLMRVTHAIQAVYRMTRSHSKPLFETLVKFRKLLYHFRFVAHSFISNLSAYVFDTAIGGNFNPFIQRLAATAVATSAPSRTHFSMVTPASTFSPSHCLAFERFSDVFSLSQSHSELLDNILSACLLRSGQREVGDILRQALGLVLDFAVVIGELHRGRLEEYEAGPMIEDVYSKFRAKMMMFTRVLKELAEKTGGNNSMQAMTEDAHEGPKRPTGGMEALPHLMMKLDMADWWTRA